MLHTRIPLHRLPKKLVVHDLLAVDSENRYGKAEDKRKVTNIWRLPDRIHGYRLKLSMAGKAWLSDEILDAVSQRLTPVVPKQTAPKVTKRIVVKSFTGIFSTRFPTLLPVQFVRHLSSSTIHHRFHIPTTEPTIALDWEKDGNLKPSMKLVCIFRPRTRLGKAITRFSTGENGSFHAICSCRRFLLVRCCVKRMLLEEDGENGGKREEKWTQKSAVFRKVVKVMKPLIGVRLACSNVIGDDQLHKLEVGGKVYVVDPGMKTCRTEIEGPIRPIRTTVGWQDRLKSTCTHLLSHQPVPPTTKVGVVAKLSLCGDYHLSREARTYQDFDQHMFEHWNGFHILPQTKELVPVGALVPRFY